MGRLRAFLYGLWECRSDATMHFGYPLIESYDSGRALGRRILNIKD